MHLAPLIHDLAVILAIAAAVTYLFQKIRQPVVLGYLIAGFIVGPHTPSILFVRDLPGVKIWAELGVIFLMFSLGLEFSFRKLSRVGVSAGFTGVFEFVAMLAVGFFCGKLFGWKTIDCIFLGAILSVSSTTIIIKALDELRVKSKHFAQLIFGVLIVEDLLAILLLVGLSTLAIQHEFSTSVLLVSAGKLVLVMGSWFLVGYLLVPRIVKRVKTTGSDELLTIMSLGLCLLLVVFAASLEYSVALGAFIMGSILAESTESHRIVELMQPLRDVFAAVFFVSVGMMMDPGAIWAHRGEVLAITIATILGKILSSTGGALATGERFRTSVKVGFGLAQIGEFSFIIAALGQTLKITSDFLYPIAVAVSVITTFTTPYLIRVSGAAADRLEKHLPRGTRRFLERYAAWTDERREVATSRANVNKRIARWLLNGFVVSVIWISLGRFGVVWLARYIELPLLVDVLGLVLAILLSSPFLWAMFASVSRGRLENDGDRARVGALTVIFQFLTVGWLGALALLFVSTKFVALLLLIGAAFVSAKFYRALEKSYHWFEGTFLSTFRESDSANTQEALRGLAPWDAHLVKLTVHPDSDVAGKCIADAQLRKRHGINVVVIHRGSKSVVSPSPLETLYPKDDLLVLGTDEQIDRARGRIEKSPGTGEDTFDPSDYALKRVHIDGHSRLLGVSIRDSGIRERFGAMVVGIERRGRRIMNPERDMVLEIDDRVLVVGKRDRVAALASKLGAS